MKMHLKFNYSYMNKRQFLRSLVFSMYNFFFVTAESGREKIHLVKTLSKPHRYHQYNIMLNIY
ncbi:hypothetical protein BpHYR1_005483 [Brachionus plicatilis]|uniref:Uncharacterized protein n=1 Tax=Brachionus plicatilis TaxID=10195 RepID=A0A3M7S3D5_BRAPC|nr:hypothetical protein BpHYR1_005483 [Brachionus plicatilis]